MNPSKNRARLSGAVDSTAADRASVMPSRAPVPAKRTSIPNTDTGTSRNAVRSMTAGSPARSPWTMAKSRNRTRNTPAAAATTPRMGLARGPANHPLSMLTEVDDAQEPEQLVAHLLGRIGQHVGEAGHEELEGRLGRAGGHATEGVADGVERVGDVSQQQTHGPRSSSPPRRPPACHPTSSAPAISSVPSARATPGARNELRPPSPMASSAAVASVSTPATASSATPTPMKATMTTKANAAPTRRRAVTAPPRSRPGGRRARPASPGSGDPGRVGGPVRRSRRQCASRLAPTPA